ncbi:hypothetical protein [Sphingobacterium anhuiense]
MPNNQGIVGIVNSINHSKLKNGEMSKILSAAIKRLIHPYRDH